MVPKRDRIDVWWNLATVPWRTKTRRTTRFLLDGTDNLIDAPATQRWGAVEPHTSQRRRRMRHPPNLSLVSAAAVHSTVTLLARLRGLSTSHPRSTAQWYAKSWSGITVSSGITSSRLGGT